VGAARPPTGFAPPPGKNKNLIITIKTFVFFSCKVADKSLEHFLFCEYSSSESSVDDIK
jgi:hypothetical protein